MKKKKTTRRTKKNRATEIRKRTARMAV